MSFIDQLIKIEAKMEHFTSPDIKDGFHRHFVFWVYKTWSKCEYIETEVVDVGYDCSSHPVKTGKLSSDECKTYKEFIHSNTGNSVCTYNSGSGMACESFSEKLNELFGDVCSEKLNELLKAHDLAIPEKYKSDYEDVGQLIFSGCVDHTEDSDLYDVCDSILSRFGTGGYEIEPYTCDICGVNEKGEFIFNGTCEFAEMTLNDFKELMVV
jgi:hypothetical protein